MSNSQKITQMPTATLPLSGSELVPIVQTGNNVSVSAFNLAAASGLAYQGLWNASTNNPTLTSSVGTRGYYYIVSTAGSTNLNGITTWNVGDWAIFSNTGVWQRIAGGIGTSLSITNDTSSNTAYNLSMVNATSGYASNLFVDSPNLTFNPSVGGGGPFSGALHTPSLYVSGYLIIGDTGSTVLSGWEAYPDGYLVSYKSNVGAGTYDRSMVTNPSNWLGIGVNGASLEEPPVYAPLYVQSTTANPQFMIANGTDAANGLNFYVDGSQNATILNYNNASLGFGNNNAVKLTMDTYGNLNQVIPSSNIHGAIQEVYYRFVNSSGTSLVNFNAYDGSIIGGPSGSGYLEINMNNGSNDQANFLSIGYNGQFGFNQNWGTYGQVFMSNGTASPPVWINVGSLPSIRAGKTEITPIEDVSWMNKLTPVSYYRLKQNDKGEYTDEAELEIDFGLIAEDVEPINPDMCFYKDGKLAGVRYFQLIAPLLKKVQDLEARLAAVEGK